jgi:hypothetical protein
MLRSNNGQKKASGKPRRKSTQPKKAKEHFEPKDIPKAVQDDESEVSMENVTKAMSSLKVVPPSIRFGGRPTAGFSKKPAPS